jgi:hypothetical protein
VPGSAAFEGLDVFVDAADLVLAGNSRTRNFGAVPVTVPATATSGRWAVLVAAPDGQPDTWSALAN